MKHHGPHDEIDIGTMLGLARNLDKDHQKRGNCERLAVDLKDQLAEAETAHDALKTIRKHAPEDQP
jgi:hypothetical protein